MTGKVGPAGQPEPCTEFTCQQCQAQFRPRNRNGIPARFCSTICSCRWHNARRLQAVAALQDRKNRKPAGLSRHAQQVSRLVCQALVPVGVRAELIRQACANLGLTDDTEIERALKRNGCATGQPSLILGASIA